MLLKLFKYSIEYSHSELNWIILRICLGVSVLEECVLSLLHSAYLLHTCEEYCLPILHQFSIHIHKVSFVFKIQAVVSAHNMSVCGWVKENSILRIEWDELFLAGKRLQSKERMRRWNKAHTRRSIRRCYCSEIYRLRSLVTCAVWILFLSNFNSSDSA